MADEKPQETDEQVTQDANDKDKAKDLGYEEQVEKRDGPKHGGGGGGGKGAKYR